MNLQTSDVRVAKVRRDELVRETDQRWADIKAGRHGLSTALTPAQRGDFHRQALAKAKAAPPAPAPGGLRKDLEGLPEKERQIAEEQIYGEWFQDRVEAAIDQAEAEAIALKGRDREAFDAAFTGAVAVDHYLEDYLREAPVSPKTRNERRGLLRRFAHWAAADGMTLGGVTRQVAGRYVSALAGLHSKTRAKHLIALRGYWGWLHRRGNVEGSDKHGGPWVGQEMPVRSALVRYEEEGKRERPFTIEEATTLLYGPWPEQMDAEWQPLMLDVSRLSLLTGMRLSEVLGLKVEDVVDAEDGRAFVLHKTKMGEGRRVPVHSALLDLVARRSAAKGQNDLLFQEVKGIPSAADTFGKRFNRYRKALGVHDKQEGQRRSLVNFHSWRRTFITWARDAGHPEADIGDVVGHKPSKDSITFGVYTQGASWAQRRAVVESVKPPRLTQSRKS